MAVEVIIKPITDHEVYDVGGKEIYKNSDGQWISRFEMSDAQNRAFRRYKSQVIDNPRFKKHTKATYKV